MVIENFQQVQPYFEWLVSALPIFFRAMLVLGIFGLIVGYLASVARHGPGEGFNVLAKHIINSVPDLVLTSPRRTWAIALLSIQESIRRYVLVVFGVFVVIILFAGWFLDVDSEHPEQLYISFVLSASTFLMLGLALVLSTFSLPNDIKTKTIYTIVTKPVRAGEIVLGRIIGFSVVCSAMLAMMGIISYFFVTGGLEHRHTIAVADLEEIRETSAFPSGRGPQRIDGKTVKPKNLGDAVKQGQTTLDAHHRHLVLQDPDGSVRVMPSKGHTHGVRKVGEGEDAVYELGPPEGMLQARVPVQGRLRFVNERGSEGGISVGDEWEYRKYIPGDSAAHGVWKFENVTVDRFGERPTAEEMAAWKKPLAERNEEEQRLAAIADNKQGLPLDLTLAVFRTNKGNIEEQIRGQIQVVNPNPAKNLASERMPFVSQEFDIQRIVIPRTLRTSNAAGQLVDVDLYDDLVDNGEVEIRIYCSERGQYFGMAEPDLYIKAANMPFAWNFLKGFISIWLLTIIVVCFGVTLSTVVSGPVAIVGSLAIFITGYFSKFIIDLASSVLFNEKTAFGGGPVEALIRIVTQRSLVADLDVPGEYFIKQFDRGVMGGLYAVANVLPNFQLFDTSRYVAKGYNIDSNMLAQHVTVMVTFAVVLTIIGYFSLRAREIAS
ncbi:ABC-2 transporter permease [Lignipirellula cremea]|uniref:ABC-2 family transporter protein n=1 Tax=Lignipirellula cremea TaxID=2528010 RepID=A0A518DUD5_9BACT|nr:ABC transporter permease [Lignipirellula cremea]QDU95438.1 ABC-2 family transporter protein [Lignipirellula cremea]